jgi:dTMP kinase
MSLGGDASDAAWLLRETWLDDVGGEPQLDAAETARALCRSLRGLGCERAWFLRELASAGSPAQALHSLAGVDDDRAWTWRHRHLARAPVPVLRSIAGLDSELAWALRARLAPSCQEVLDGIVGLDVVPAWRLRTELADLWPASTVKSLGWLGTTPRGRTLVCDLLARHPGDLALLRRAAAVADPEQTSRAAVSG